MKLFYAIILGLMVLVSACAQQAETARPAQPEAGEAMEDKEEAAEVEAPAEQEEAEVVASTEEIRVLGDGAFEPNALTIKAGDSVTWINTDDEGAIIMIFKDGNFYQNSQKFDSGESFELEFMEAGSYEYWRNVAYSGDASTITVE